MEHNKRDFIPEIFNYNGEMKFFHTNSLSVDPFDIIPIELIDYKRFYELKYEPKCALSMLDIHEPHLYFHMMGKLYKVMNNKGKLVTGRSNQVLSWINVLWNFEDSPTYEIHSFSDYIKSRRDRDEKSYYYDYKWFVRP
jgi:hypothetical protein